MKHNKVIKISHCRQCPHESQQEMCCFPVSKERCVTGDEVKLSCENHTIPENCPLEDDALHRITKQKIFELWKMVSNT